MENRVDINKIVESYLRKCYLVPSYIDLHRNDEKKAYTSYFNSLVCISEISTTYYIDDSVLNDVRNEFYTHQIYISNRNNIGTLLIADCYDLILDFINDLVLNEWFEAVVNIKKILE